MLVRLYWVLILLLITIPVLPGAAQENGVDIDAHVDSFNYVLGTQTIGIRYQFTEKTGLVETAERIKQMGSNILKISMSNRYSGNDYALPKREDVKSLSDLIQNEPSYKTVLDMPFSYYHIWAYCFTSGWWLDGFTEQEKEQEYNELYAFAKLLLERYKNTGKTFLIGHWEGDWYLHSNYNPENDPSQLAIQSMIDWLNIRQKAIDDAKRDSNATGVHIYHYTEVNLVQKALKGGKCLVNNVLPHTNVDYVSYSSYDTVIPRSGNTSQALHEALDYIESKLPAKPGIGHKRVFIGEYGFPLESVKTPEQQDIYARDVCQAGLQWGCPFILYWEMYCNENQSGEHRGFWLINNENQKQPFYFTLENYYRKCKSYFKDFSVKNNRFPTESEFQTKSIDLLKQSSNRPTSSSGKCNN